MLKNPTSNLNLTKISRGPYDCVFSQVQVLSGVVTRHFHWRYIIDRKPPIITILFCLFVLFCPLLTFYSSWVCIPWDEFSIRIEDKRYRNVKLFVKLYNIKSIKSLLGNSRDKTITSLSESLRLLWQVPVCHLLEHELDFRRIKFRSHSVSGAVLGTFFFWGYCPT